MACRLSRDPTAKMGRPRFRSLVERRCNPARRRWVVVGTLPDSAPWSTILEDRSCRGERHPHHRHVILGPLAGGEQCESLAWSSSPLRFLQPLPPCSLADRGRKRPAIWRLRTPLARCGASTSRRGSSNTARSSRAGATLSIRTNSSLDGSEDLRQRRGMHYGRSKGRSGKYLRR